MSKFQKVVLDTRLNREKLFCDSDDIVMTFDLLTKERHWFLKQKPWRLTEFKRDTMNCILGWAPVDTAPFSELCEDLEKDLVVCALMVRYLLG
ncbi:hypothetical protein BaRGS_00017554 [Batillaria attramentaria]|uniref:Uncharacterized protein n=1 Tax=Batillaria attramentaria TaxID=370345 RepID=A0ABD0KWG8_9CAEN